jgi:peptidoglycan hydrolase-like protein with peptidoglycan-binding domain
MTLAMPDSINVNNLPAGYPAYLGYGDGNWPTAKALEAMFPDAEHVILTVAGGPAAHGVRVAPGTDVEPMDLTAAQGAAWASGHAGRPVIYASVQGEPGYGMHEVLAELRALGIPRTAVRLLSAHYGDGPHICGPDSCKLIGTEMDGTQWTDAYGVKISDDEIVNVDMSMLADDFFGAAPQTETERLVTELGTVRQGMTGAAVRTVQGLCNARQSHMLAIDGVFGPETLAIVRSIQFGHALTVDGIVGLHTWPVLLGVA